MCNVTRVHSIQHLGSVPVYVTETMGSVSMVIKKYRFIVDRHSAGYSELYARSRLQVRLVAKGWAWYTKAAAAVEAGYNYYL